MKTTQLIAALTTIATTNPDGYTVNAQTLEPIKSGYAVAVAETQNSFGPEGLAKVIKYVQDHSEIAAFGGWYNSDDKQFYFDATIIVATKLEAIELAKLNKQLAFFCLDNGKTYNQDGTERR